MLTAVTNGKVTVSGFSNGVGTDARGSAEIMLSHQGSNIATCTSTLGTIDNAAGTIIAVPNGTTLAAFKAAITPAAKATFEVYNADGITVATDLASTYKVIVTAEDKATTKTYTVTVL